MHTRISGHSKCKDHRNNLDTIDAIILCKSFHLFSKNVMAYSHGAFIHVITKRKKTADLNTDLYKTNSDLTSTMLGLEWLAQSGHLAHVQFNIH